MPFQAYLQKYARYNGANACDKVELKIFMGIVISPASVEPQPVRFGVLGCGHYRRGEKCGDYCAG